LYGRLKIIKSIAPLTAIVVKQSEIQTREAIRKGFKDFVKNLKTSFATRIASSEVKA
jgi:mannitol-specific phosphotransferase system IIBC component